MTKQPDSIDCLIRQMHKDCPRKIRSEAKKELMEILAYRFFNPDKFSYYTIRDKTKIAEALGYRDVNLDKAVKSCKINLEIREYTPLIARAGIALGLTAGAIGGLAYLANNFIK
jgi:hypothetical protein